MVRPTPSALATAVTDCSPSAMAARAIATFSGCHARRAATEAAAGARQPRAGALADDLSLELGKDTEDEELKPPRRCRGIDLLSERPRPDIPAAQVLDQFDQVPKAPRPSRSSRQTTSTSPSPGSEIVQRGVQLGTMLERARTDILKHARAAVRLQRSDLQREVLLVGRHPRVADALTHCAPPIAQSMP